MTIERNGNVSPELKFGGAGKAESIKKGFAITTLRNPRPSYNFSQGQEVVADCFDDAEKVKIVILTNETKRLKDFSPFQLALDGFSSVAQAVAEMRTYPGYENINEDSSIQAITFVLEEVWDALPSKVADSIYGRTFDDLLDDPSLGHIFYY